MRREETAADHGFIDVGFVDVETKLTLKHFLPSNKIVDEST